MGINNYYAAEKTLEFVNRGLDSDCMYRQFSPRGLYSANRHQQFRAATEKDVGIFIGSQQQQQKIRRELFAPDTRRIVFSGDQAEIFADLRESPPADMPIHAPFTRFLLLFDHPISFARLMNEYAEKHIDNVRESMNKAKFEEQWKKHIEWFDAYINNQVRSEHGNYEYHWISPRHKGVVERVVPVEVSPDYIKRICEPESNWDYYLEDDRILGMYYTKNTDPASLAVIDSLGRTIRSHGLILLTAHDAQINDAPGQTLKLLGWRGVALNPASFDSSLIPRGNLPLMETFFQANMKEQLSEATMRELAETCNDFTGNRISRLFKWILGYTMSKSVVISEQAIPRSVRRRAERKGLPPPDPWHIVEVDPKLVRRSESGVVAVGGSNGKHRKHGYRYDVMGFMRIGKHKLRDGTFRSGMEFVRPHQRGLKNDLYVPSTRSVSQTGNELYPVEPEVATQPSS
jgi:hypothetical protein